MNSYAFPSKSVGLGSQNAYPITYTYRSNPNYGLDSSFQNLKIGYMSPMRNSGYHDLFEEVKPQRILIEEERKERDDEKRYIYNKI